jgi:hypothetical protein
MRKHVKCCYKIFMMSVGRHLLWIISACFINSNPAILEAQPFSAKVTMYAGKPAIWINNQPVYPIIYALPDVPGGRWTWEEMPQHTIKTFYDQGIRIFQTDVFLDQLWKKDGTVSIDTLRRQISGIAHICSHAAVMIRLHVNPPKWWIVEHPEENTAYADTHPEPDYAWGLQRIIEDDIGAPFRPSMASELWKKQVSEKIKQILHILAKTPEGDLLIGVQVAYGVYGEWHYWGFIQHEPDVSVPMRRYFQTWLKEKYHTVTALRRAWHNDSINFDEVTVPGLTERKHTDVGIFRDPASERPVIDYYEAQHQVVADDILYFCKLIKASWPRPIITGAFYGYFFAVFGREAAGGHLELMRVLQSPYIDFLCGPRTYYPDAEALGDPYRSRSLILSCLLHHKLWLDEMDQQAPLVSWKDSTYKKSVIASSAILLRNMSFTLTKGMGFWFYDFGLSGFNGGPRLQNHGVAGWWDDPYLMKLVHQFKSFVDTQYQKPYQSDADVLMVFDTRTFYYVGSDKQKTALTHFADNWMPLSVFRSGAVHDVVHIDDLPLIDLKHYRVIIFVNTYVLDDKQKRFIHDVVEKDNRHIIWVYAPAYSDGERLSVDFISSITGVYVRQNPDSIRTAIRVNEGLAENPDINVWNTHITPSFYVDDSVAHPLAYYVDTRRPAIAYKRFNDFTSWFVALPFEDTRLMQYMLRQAGVHLYDESGKNIFYAGAGVLVIHTSDTGKQVIHLKNGKEISLQIREPSTLILDTQTGKLLLSSNEIIQ